MGFLFSIDLFLGEKACGQKKVLRICLYWNGQNIFLGPVVSGKVG